MKQQYRHAALAAAVALAWGVAQAQSPARTDRSEEYARSLSHADYLKGEDLRASKLVGARVRNATGDTLGEIEELMIGSERRADTLVIVSVGGVADIGDKLVAVPYHDLRVSPDGDTFYVDRSEQQLKAAPAYKLDAQAEAQTREPRRVGQRETQAAQTTPARAANDRPRPTAAPAATSAKSANVVLDAFDYRASDIIGAPVLDDRGEHVAEVDDVVVSTEDDKLHAVLAVGGFAGFGADLITVPFDDLQITADGDAPQVRIPMTRAQLEQLVESRPEFTYKRQVARNNGNDPRG
jgi:sporulation protein YlmC with PRC-barrel domain